ncbi:beta-galactosidase trimerization domain-containing protein [Paenibacillus albidus]|uniref:beta-galactosidase trimerization domain-containing protein n=1 Tax=Paenibacillus albidus TaxID=2041023 RepID=UPI001BEC7512|nr:beta-galactosidase trimerization domain-containing protein [Paenibacillus albidus]MBT2292848.1 beta-galactosidase trimerization domain-containing protein [Paenibacillus albidus]
MTGKFHTSWGELGGYKHPNALRFEAALSLAHGAKCSIGDQLHPRGLMDEATYSLIGVAYAEVEAKEAWCSGVANVADIAVLSLEAVLEQAPGRLGGPQNRNNPADIGAVRMLNESHYLYDVVDASANFAAYKVLLLPDDIMLWPELAAKIGKFMEQGGKVLATGRSGLKLAGDGFALDLGVTWLGRNEYKPNYFRPDFTPGALLPASFVMYSEGQMVELTASGRVLGQQENPYFNRDVFTFCSHLHTPSDQHPAGPGMVATDSSIYIAWNVFSDYADNGHLILKEMVKHALGLLLPEATLQTDLPAQGIATLQHQQAGNRYVNHLLYANPVKKGRVEVIEDIVPLYDIQVNLRLPTVQQKVDVTHLEQADVLGWFYGDKLVSQVEVYPLLERGRSLPYQGHDIRQ